MTPDQQRYFNVRMATTLAFEFACMTGKFDAPPKPFEDVTEADIRRYNDETAKAIGCSDVLDYLRTFVPGFFTKGTFDGAEGQQRLHDLADVLDRDYPTYLVPLTADAGMIEMLEGQGKFVRRVAKKIGIRSKPAKLAAEQIGLGF